MMETVPSGSSEYSVLVLDRERRSRMESRRGERGAGPKYYSR